MTATSWRRFCHAPCDVRLLALLRIGFASLVLVHWLAMLPHLRMLWSVQGMLPLSDISAVAGGFVPTVFQLLPESDVVIALGYGLLGLHALLLLVGLRSRLQLAAVLCWLVSFQNRNLLVVNGQDAVLRLIGIFLLLAPIGAAWSLDARRLRAALEPPYYPVRLIQVQIAIVLFSAGIWKLQGDDWTDGSALYYVTRLDGFWGNLPLPAALPHSKALLCGLTWATLALELAVPVLIWLPRTRRVALALALSFHACLAYAMNLFLFAPIMLLGWCSFLQREDLDALGRLLQRRARRAPPPSLQLEGTGT
jgi:hypothetical protein